MLWTLVSASFLLVATCSLYLDSALLIPNTFTVVPVHCFGGSWGLLAVGLLAEPTRLLKAYGTDSHPGFLYSLAMGSPDANLLGCQVIGAAFVVAWTLFTMVSQPN